MQRFELAYPTGDRATSTLLVEKFVPREVRVGERYGYTIRVTNLSDAPIANVVIDDTGAAVAVGKPGDAKKAGAGHWMIPMLAAGETKTLQASGVGQRVGTRTSCLTVDYQPRMCSEIAVVDPELRIERRAPEVAYVCDRPTITYSVTNTVSGTARDVTIHEPLPDGLLTADGKNAVTIELGAMPAGKTVTKEVTLRPTRTGIFESRAVARSQTDEAVTDPAAIRFVQPQLDVAIAGPKTQYVGEPIRYQVTVTNRSDIAARDTEVGLRSTARLDNPHRELGTLAPGQSRSFAVTVPTTGDHAQLTASARSTCAQVTSNQIATTIQRLPGLRIGTVDTHDPVMVGETTTYVVTITNQGDAPARDLDVIVQLPEGMRVVNIDGPGEPRVEGDRLILGKARALAAKRQLEWNVEVRAETPGMKRFRTEVNSAGLASPVPDVEPTRVIATR